MAVQPCKMCDTRPGDVILALVATGDSDWVCLPCLPFYVGGLFESAGMPGLSFAFEDGEASDEDEHAAAHPAEPLPPEPEGAGVLAAIAADEAKDDALEGTKNGADRHPSRKPSKASGASIDPV